jgi:hypothetical protein
MTRTICYLVAGTLLLGGCISYHETKRIVEEKDKPSQVLRHVVLFKFKDDTSSADVKKIENAFCALPSKIDAVYEFEWGTDVSIENRQQGFTHCFVVTFRTEEDRGKYLSHPEHKKFGELLGPHLDKVLVVDFWAKP